jgi:hypothetical protein
MADNISLMSQTTYAELLDRARASAFSNDFPDDEGVFVSKTTRGRVYWYFQESSAHGRRQKYVGPETDDLRERIAAHNAARTYRRDQRSLVATLVRSGNLPSPRRDIGDLVAALAAAGVFRLRGVLVGTVAYQAYSPLLGVRLPAALVQTGDVDLAQDANVSAEVADATPVSDVLRQVDISFRPVPRINSARFVSYMAASGLRVDFLTSNRGPDTDEPRTLPAFGVDAQPLRFMDFLIKDPEPAVLLHGTGVLVSVPAPQRFALHKLIVARRRHEDSGKREKDLMQAGALLDALVERRPHELRAAWDEAFGRGKAWRRLIGEGLGLLHPAIRDKVLRTVGASRQVVPGMALRFVPEKAAYDETADGVRFFALCSGPLAFNNQQGVRCLVTRDAVSFIARNRALDRDQCLEVFREYRNLIETTTRTKYLERPVDSVGEVWLAGSDIMS